MPFAIIVQSAHFRIAEGETVDPVTGWGFPEYQDTGLTSVERQSTINLLLRMGGRRPGIDDRVELTLPDGSLAEVHLVGLYSNGQCTHGQLTATEPSPAFLRLAMEVAQVANLILRPDGFPRPLVVSEERRRTLLGRYPQVQSVFSAAMLWNLLVPRTMDPRLEPLAD